MVDFFLGGIRRRGQFVTWSVYMLQTFVMASTRSHWIPSYFKRHLGFPKRGRYNKRHTQRTLYRNFRSHSKRGVTYFSKT